MDVDTYSDKRRVLRAHPCRGSGPDYSEAVAEDDIRAGLPADLRELIDSWVGTPAFVRDRHLDVVASNALARAVSPAFVEGVNLARNTFVESAIENRPGGPEIARAVTKALRNSLDRHEADAQFVDLVRELEAQSGSFAGAWAEPAADEEDAALTFVTEAVGAVRLHYQDLRIPDQNEYTLVVMRPADESSRLSLTRLSELTTGLSES